MNIVKSLISPEILIKEILIKSLELEDINEIDSIGLLDTFPEDYQIGVYLPLLIPLLFPIIQAIFFEIKRHHKN